MFRGSFFLHPYDLGECVAISSHNIPTTWYCDACVIRRKATEALNQMRKQADHQRQQRLFARQKNIEANTVVKKVKKTSKGKRQKRKWNHTTEACLDDDDNNSDTKNDDLGGVLSCDDCSSQDWSFEAQWTNILWHLILNSLDNRSNAEIEINLQHAQQFYLHKWEHGTRKWRRHIFPAEEEWWHMTQLQWKHSSQCPLWIPRIYVVLSQSKTGLCSESVDA